MKPLICVAPSGLLPSLSVHVASLFSFFFFLTHAEQKRENRGKNMEEREKNGLNERERKKGHFCLIKM